MTCPIKLPRYLVFCFTGIPCVCSCAMEPWAGGGDHSGPWPTRGSIEPSSPSPIPTPSPSPLAPLEPAGSPRIAPQPQAPPPLRHTHLRGNEAEHVLGGLHAAVPGGQPGAFQQRVREPGPPVGGVHEHAHLRARGVRGRGHSPAPGAGALWERAGGRGGGAEGLRALRPRHSPLLTLFNTGLVKPVTRTHARGEPQKQEQEHKESGWSTLLRSCRAAPDVCRSVEGGRSATECWRARVQGRSLALPRPHRNPGGARKLRSYQCTAMKAWVSATAQAHTQYTQQTGHSQDSGQQSRRPACTESHQDKDINVVWLREAPFCGTEGEEQDQVTHSRTDSVQPLAAVLDQSPPNTQTGLYCTYPYTLCHLEGRSALGIHWYAQVGPSDGCNWGGGCPSLPPPPPLL